jgi:ABC-type phosphate transport system auxiliary subunit
LTVSSGLPSGLGTGASSEEVQVWQKKVVELQNELLDRNSIIKQLKTQLAGQLDNKAARALMADLSEQLATHSTTGDELEDEMKSKYLSL